MKRKTIKTIANMIFNFSYNLKNLKGQTAKYFKILYALENSSHFLKTPVC